MIGSGSDHDGEAQLRWCVPQMEVVVRVASRWGRGFDVRGDWVRAGGIGGVGWQVCGAVQGCASGSAAAVICSL